MRSLRSTFMLALVLASSAALYATSPPKIKLLDLDAPGVVIGGRARHMTGPTGNQVVLFLEGHLNNVEDAEANPCFVK